MSIIGIPLQKPARREFHMPSMEELAAIFADGSPDGPGSPGGPGGGPGFEDNSDCRPAVQVTGKELEPEAAVPGAIFGGKITAGASNGLKVVAYDGITGGIHVSGGNHTATDAVISLSGRGKGLAGRGTGASVKNHGQLTLRNSAIYTNGKARGCTAAEDFSTLRVYDSVLVAMGAPYGDPNVPPVTGPAASPPAALEIEGNCRAHCTMSNSSSFFYRSRIYTDGWAALSTDASNGYVYLEANDCQVVSTKSGYGIYADGGCHDEVNRCRFDVASMAAIIGGESDVTFRDSNLKCGTYGALLHSVNGQDTEVGTAILEHCSLHSGKEAFLVKSDNVEICLRDSNVISDCGILVRTIVNDDPIATKVGPNPVYGVNVILTDMDVSGDLIHEDPDRDMWISLTSSVLRGAIVNAVLSMDRGSKWIATHDSQVTLLGSAEEAQIDALPGVVIRMKCSTSSECKLPSGGTLIAGN